MSEKIVIDGRAALLLLNCQVDYGDKKKGLRYVSGWQGDEFETSIELVIDNLVRLIYMPFGVIGSATDLHLAGSGKDGETAESREYGNHCVAKTAGVKLLPQIEKAFSATHVIPLVKGQHPGMVCNSVITSSNFPQFVAFLRGQGEIAGERVERIDKIFVAGFPFSSAVASSAIELMNQHITDNVYVVLDACRSDGPPRRDPALMRNILKMYNVKLIEASQLAR